MTGFDAKCIKYGYDFAGYDVKKAYTNHWADCAELCRKLYIPIPDLLSSNCLYWTWFISSKVCWLKYSNKGYYGAIFLCQFRLYMLS